MTARRLLITRRAATVVIAANVFKPNIKALATAQGWDGYGNVDVVINSGVYVVALEIIDMPHDVVTITNNGIIGGTIHSDGTGMYIRNRIRVINNGTIFGCGGTGGVGSSVSVCWGGACHSASGGDGGIGAGFYTTNSWATVLYRATGLPGVAGQNDHRPSSGYPGDSGSDIVGGTGGTGGSIGVAGSPGGDAQAYGSYDYYNATVAGSGAPAGYYINGNSFVTWLVNGNRYGRVI